MSSAPVGNSGAFSLCWIRNGKHPALHNYCLTAIIRDKPVKRINFIAINFFDRRRGLQSLQFANLEATHLWFPSTGDRNDA